MNFTILDSSVAIADIIIDQYCEKIFLSFIKEFVAIKTMFSSYLEIFYCLILLRAHIHIIF